MVRRCSILAAGSYLALALSNSAQASSTITAAAIAAGRLYVVGTTDQPHTSVSLDGKFTAESDDKGKFQYELVYYPVGCVVRVTIGGKTIEAKIEQCGEICDPAPQARASSAPKPSLIEPSSGQRSVAQAPPVRPQGVALVAPEAPPTTATFTPPTLAVPQSKAGRGAEPILDPPLPPRRPKEFAGVALRPLISPRAVVRTAPAANPSPRPKPPQQAAPNDQPSMEPPDAPEGSDVY